MMMHRTRAASDLARRRCPTRRQRVQQRIREGLWVAFGWQDAYARPVTLARLKTFVAVTPEDVEMIAAAGLCAAEFASVVGCSPQRLHYLLSADGRVPREPLRGRIAAVLAIQPGDLYLGGAS